MSYFTTAEHSALIANPSSIATLYGTHSARFKSDLGGGFAAEIEQHFQFGFCGLVAFDLKQYGQSTAVTMPDLLAATALDCDNYAILMWRLFLLLCPNATTNVSAVGWNNGPIGNHAQMHCHKNSDAQGNGGGSWLVDPTVGIMMCGHDFDWIAGGKPLVSLSYMKSFHSAGGRYGSVTQPLHDQVFNALRYGQYRPSQLLYYYVDLSRYINPVPDYADWMTPQGSALASP